MKDITTDLATMEDDEGKGMAVRKSMSANGILGQSSPHRSDVFLDGVFSVLYPGFPHIFSHQYYIYQMSTIQHSMSTCPFKMMSVDLLRHWK